MGFSRSCSWKKYFPCSDQYESGFAFIPTNPPCLISSTTLLGFYSFCSHSPVSIIQGNTGLKWKESANKADID